MPQITTVQQLRNLLAHYQPDDEVILTEPPISGPFVVPVFRIHGSGVVHAERELDSQPENAPAKNYLVLDIVHVSNTKRFHDPNGASIDWPGK